VLHVNVLNESFPHSDNDQRSVLRSSKGVFLWRQGRHVIMTSLSRNYALPPAVPIGVKHDRHIVGNTFVGASSVEAFSFVNDMFWGKIWYSIHLDVQSVNKQLSSRHPQHDALPVEVAGIRYRLSVTCVTLILWGLDSRSTIEL
jgi:hypothetical protein